MPKLPPKKAVKKKVKRRLPTIHLMIVANTHDKEIGVGCKHDMRSIRKLFRNIVRRTPFQLTEYLVAGKKYTQDNIFKTLKSIKPKKLLDVVIFYYTGHGFSYQKDRSKKYPQLDFRSNPADSNIKVVNAHTKNLEDIFATIKEKGAGLNFVFGDCCNSTIDYKKLHVRKKKLPENKCILVNQDNCRQLFTNLDAHIISAAAKKGQYAISDKHIGSIYTYSFVKKFTELLNAKKGIGTNVWEYALKLAQVETLKESRGYDIGTGKPSRQDSIYIVQKDKMDVTNFSGSIQLARYPHK